eukprot:11028947-Heterocapsa_arctica.AAC.1
MAGSLKMMYRSMSPQIFASWAGDAMSNKSSTYTTSVEPVSAWDQHPGWFKTGSQPSLRRRLPRCSSQMASDSGWP